MDYFYKSMMKGRYLFQRILLAITAAFVFIFINGYQFNNGDQEEHLPYVYKLLNPELYPSDYLVPEQESTFTVRYYFAHLIAVPARFIPVDIVVFLLYLICLTVITYSITELTLSISPHPLPGLIAPFVLLFSNHLTLGGNSLIDVQLTCTVIAVALGAVAMVTWQKNRLWSALALCGLGSLFQVLIGLQLAVIILLSEVLVSRMTKHSLMKSLQGGLVFLLFSAPVLIPVFLNYFKSAPAGGEEAYFNIMFYGRNAHHYVPSHFPVRDYILTAVWWLVCIRISINVFGKGGSNRLLTMLAVAISGMLLYSISFFGFESKTMAMTQWFKSSIWPGLYCTALFPHALTGMLREIRYQKWLNPVLSTTSLVLLLMITNSDLLPFSKLRYRYKIGNYPETQIEKMHHWIERNTPLEAVILPMPNDDSFLCEARRSIPVGYKGIIHTPSFMLRWYKEFHEVYGLMYPSNPKDSKMLENAIKAYPTLSDDEIISPVNIDFRLFDTSSLSMNSISEKNIVHAEPPYILVRFGAYHH